jgi:hypothetical protein
VSALTFEANSIAHEQPAAVARLSALLESWARTLDPIVPGTMSANSKHAGCNAYTFPGGPDALSTASGRAEEDLAADYAAQIEREAQLDPYRV